MVSHWMLCGFGDSLDSLLLVWVFLFVVVFHLFVLCSSGFLSAGFLLKSPDIVKRFWERLIMYTLFSNALCCFPFYNVPLSIVPYGWPPLSRHDAIRAASISIEHRAFGMVIRTK